MSELSVSLPRSPQLITLQQRPPGSPLMWLSGPWSVTNLYFMRWMGPEQRPKSSNMKESMFAFAAFKWTRTRSGGDKTKTDATAGSFCKQRATSPPCAFKHELMQIPGVFWVRLWCLDSPAWWNFVGVWESWCNVHSSAATSPLFPNNQSWSVCSSRRRKRLSVSNCVLTEGAI